jgi:hypothetical protein
MIFWNITTIFPLFWLNIESKSFGIKWPLYPYLKKLNQEISIEISVKKFDLYI